MASDPNNRAVRRQEARAEEKAANAAPQPREDANQPQPALNFTLRIPAEDLEDRHIRGVGLAQRVDRSNGSVIELNETTTIYASGRKDHRMYQVVREITNERGVRRIKYECDCDDFDKEGRIDCMHIFAEKIRRGEVVIVGEISHSRWVQAKAGRRPARKRKTRDGKNRSRKTSESEARVAMPTRIPQLIEQLRRQYDEQFPFVGKPEKGGQAQDASSRAAALLCKIEQGKSAETMTKTYAELIESGVLNLRNPPHRNTITEWMNDAKLTPILMHFLDTTAKKFTQVEIAGIVDSSKLSQMRSAHSRYVEYGDDIRAQADWVKLHALVGVETMVVMAVVFSGSRGKGTHDINFVVQLLLKALSLGFDLKYLLGDKAYLSENVLGKLWEKGIRAVIPVKKKWDYTTKDVFYEACKGLVEWFDKNHPDFHEIYRLRPKIEALFSMLKRMADGYCWSRGRRNRRANSGEPCTAWMNEMLCKLIYVNLRITVDQEADTGYKVNYLARDNALPAIPEADRLLRAA